MRSKPECYKNAKKMDATQKHVHENHHKVLCFKFEMNGGGF